MAASTPPALPRYQAGADMGDYVTNLAQAVELEFSGISARPVLSVRNPTATGTMTVPIYAVGTAAGPTWTTGSIAPVAVQPVGSLYSRIGGAVGATLYVSRGAGTWNAVAGV